VKFEWDPEKAASNLAKHRVSVDAAPRLDWSNSIVTPHIAGGEPRYAALVPLGDRLRFYAYVVRSDVFRIISLRKANTREIRRYTMEL